MSSKYFADLTASQDYREALSRKVAKVFQEEPSQENDKESAILELIRLCIDDTFDCRETAIALNNVKSDVFKSDEQREALVRTVENAVWFWATQIEFDDQQPSDQWKQLAKLTANLFNMKTLT